jgi:hypothetical protein
MEYRQIPHDRCSELWELCARHLVEVIYNLAQSAYTNITVAITHLSLERSGSKKLGSRVC